jgi:predicted nucleotidyltransferase
MLLFQNIHAIRNICKECLVSNLYAIGSIVNDPDVQPTELEFLVEFNQSTGDSYFHYFYSLQNQLADLLQMQVQLTDLNQLKNPNIKARMLQNSECLVGQALA